MSWNERYSVVTHTKEWSVWVVWTGISDDPIVAVFDNELDALRFAVEYGYSVRKMRNGEAWQ